MPRTAQPSRVYRTEEVLRLQILARALENECLMRYVSHPENVDTMAEILGTALDSLEALGRRPAASKTALSAVEKGGVVEGCPRGYHHENSACVPDEYRARLHTAEGVAGVHADRRKPSAATRLAPRR